MKKSELNQNIHIQEGNSVLVDNNDYGFLIFSLPARECCPFATELCKKICYGRNAQELFKHVYECRKRNFNETLKEEFVTDVIDIIEFNLQRKKYKNKTIIFRIHETGDLYSQEYTDKWFEISDYFRGNERIIFQCYTKSLPFIRDKIKDCNIKIMFSIMQDTLMEDIDLAKKLGMNTFEAVPSEIFDDIPTDQKCEGSCCNCKKCYIGNEDMVVEYHGNRIPGKVGSARTQYKTQLYWGWKKQKEKIIIDDVITIAEATEI